MTDSPGPCPHVWVKNRAYQGGAGWYSARHLAEFWTCERGCGAFLPWKRPDSPPGPEGGK